MSLHRNAGIAIRGGGGFFKPTPRPLLAAIGALALSWPAASLAVVPVVGGRLDFAVGSQPWAVASGDLNGDGKPDLVTANSNANTVSVLLGDGSGGYGPKTDCPVGNYPLSVAIVDLNGDGRPDLAVANYSYPASVSVLLGNGAGGFAPRTDVPMVGAQPTALAAGDLNADGQPDLALTLIGSGVAVLLGDGAGGFGPRTTYTPGINPYSVAIGDLSGDGNPDLVVANTYSGTVSVLLGDGTGGFAPKTDYPVGSAPYSVALGDLNSDGRLDVAVANYGTLSSSVGVCLGDGAGGLGAMTEFVIGSDSRPHSVAIGDFNGDGKPDLAVALYNARSLQILIGDGTGAFSIPAYPAITNFGTPPQPIAVAVADVNGDGRPDFAVANFGADTLSVMLGNDNGGFASHTEFATASFPFRAATGDLNGDGKLDLVVGSGGGSAVSVLLGNGSGGFGAHTDFTTGASPYAVAIGDLNGDGKPDLAVACNGSVGPVSILLGNGAGGFGPKVDYNVGNGPWTVVLADLNGDGKPDVATANSGSSNVSVLAGNGDGTFGVATNYPVGTNPYWIAAGDLNGDGRPDLVTANGGSTNLSVLLNSPSGFLAATNYPTLRNPISVAIADVNGDGRLDLIATNYDNNPWGVSVLLGNGSGGFAPKVDFWDVNGAYPYSAAVGDLNGDGKPDIAIASTYNSTIDVLFGNGAGQFGALTTLPTATGLSVAGLGDLNGDGKLDIVASTSSGVSVLLALRSTRTSLSVSPGVALIGAPLTLTVTVAAVPPATGTPAGTVSFFDGFTLLGTSPVNGGVAGLALFAPRLGSRPITAVYNGDGKFQRSFSPVQNLRVVATAGPALAGIADIQSDQGRQVRVQFHASAYDYLGSPTPITQYEVYRQVNPALGFVGPEAFATAPARVQVDGWDFVGSVTAHDESAYDLVVPTLADSNGAGIHRAVFFVRAATGSPYVYFDSASDSGYSVDNLAPAVPAPFTGVFSNGATHLHWGANLEPDLWYYRLYRGSSAGFVPGPTNLIATPADTGFADPGNPGSYYKLSAVDVDGNESGYAVLSPGGTVDVPGDETFAFALEGARPNPVRGPGLAVHFTLPTSAPARLELLDVGGRRVATRDVGALGVGRHAVDLAAGRSLAPGLYLLRLTQGANARTTRVAVLP